MTDQAEKDNERLTDKATQDNERLIAFWDKALALSEEDKAETEGVSPEAWKEMAPSEKLFWAAASLGGRKKVLDYGCGSGWAGIVAAKSGCPDITAADPAPGAVESTAFYADLFGVSGQVHASCITPDWLQSVPDGSFDGFICSNVLDVIPPETAEEILRGAARVVTKNASVIIGLNYYLSPEAAAARKVELMDGNRLYVDGVLRLVSRTDEEWEKIFSPWFTVEKLEYFAWPGEKAETRRLFYLRRKEDAASLPVSDLSANGAAEPESSSRYTCLTLRERPELMRPAAAWFHDKWGVPEAAYLECMEACLSGGSDYDWYLCLDGEKIIAGMGVIENDFHDRKDLAPNVCAVYTEEAYRCQGIAGRLLNLTVEDMKKKGISPLYLVTDHIGFYERYGWEFFCMVQGDGEPEMTRMYIHR